MSHRIAVLVSGSGTNLQALFDAVDHDPSFGGRVVVVGSDRPGCGGLDRACRRGVPAVAEPLDAYPDRDSWERALTEQLAVHRPDIVVLAGFMRILSPAFVSRWSGRIVNVHPSLLPAFPGAHAVRDALAHGVKVTGATVHLVDEHVDHGPIVAQRAIDIGPHDDAEAVHERLKAVEHELLPAVVKLLCHGRILVDGRRTSILPAHRAEALTLLDAGSPA